LPLSGFATADREKYFLSGLPEINHVPVSDYRCRGLQPPTGKNIFVKKKPKPIISRNWI
jgi:hypothetical protein